jgi:hypothetical protein
MPKDNVIMRSDISLENKVKNGPEIAVKARIYKPHNTSSTAEMIFTIFMALTKTALYWCAPPYVKNIRI